MVLVPPPLAPGDRVRIIAPSGCFGRDAFDRGVALLEQAGLEASYDDGVFARRRYLAGDDDRRRHELAVALADPRARALWVARGGYGATRLLPGVAPGPIRDAPRWLIGFSDATALHALWARAGVASMHGPNVTTLASWTEEARRELFGLLASPREVTYAGELARPGPCAEGRLLGGNLTLLASMAGTGALPSFDGAVVLVEDVGERPYRLDRALTQLVQAGAFDGVRGIAVGQLTSCTDAADAALTALDSVLDALAGLRVPVLAGLPFGHEPSARALVLGARAELDPERATLTVRAA